MQFGRSYEEFEVGATYKHWPGKTVTEYDDHLFCLLTMNHHPLHLDAHYAEETTQFGKNVVVGNYVYSILLGMSVPDISGKAIANLEIESLRHVAPTFHGDTLYGETTVLDKWESKSKDDRGVVHVETIGYNQDGTVVCVFRRKVMVPKDSYLEARGGEQPGRPVPRPDKNWPGPAGRMSVDVEVWLVRHGETEWSRDHKHTSTTELELTADGEAVARSWRRASDAPSTWCSRARDGAPATPPCWPATRRPRSTRTSWSGTTATTRASPPPRSGRPCPGGRCGPTRRPAARTPPTSRRGSTASWTGCGRSPPGTGLRPRPRAAGPRGALDRAAGVGGTTAPARHRDRLGARLRARANLWCCGGTPDAGLPPVP